MDSQVQALPEQGQTLPSCCSTVGTRAGKSKSLIWWTRRKGGKRWKKAEKADLIMQLAFWHKRKSSLFFLLLSVLLAKSPLDDISSHQAISGLSRHGALTVPGSNPPPTLLSHSKRPWWETSMCQSFLGRLLQIDPQRSDASQNDHKSKGYPSNTSEAAFTMQKADKGDLRRLARPPLK